MVQCKTCSVVTLGQCRRAFNLKQEAQLRWTRDRPLVNWEEIVRCQVSTNEAYYEAKRQLSVRNRDVLMNTQSPNKWWFNFKSVVFSSSSTRPLLVGGGGGLVYDSLVRLICCQIILTAGRPWSLLICHSLAIRLLVSPTLPSGRVRLGVSC